MKTMPTMRSTRRLADCINSDPYDADNLLCPVCSFEYVHFGTPETVSSDNYPEEGIGYRGSVVRIPMNCENGHNWFFVVQFHKGQTLIGLIVEDKPANYAKYLQTDHWKTTRKAAIDRAGGVCQFCRSTEQLNVHHNTYERLGEELPSDLLVLCQTCHATLHEVQDGRPTRMPEQS